MGFSWQISADVTGLTDRMKGVRTIARLGMPLEERARAKDEVLSFIKSSCASSAKRFCISFSRDRDVVRVLLSSNIRVCANGKASSGHGLLQIRSEIPFNETKNLNPEFLNRIFLDTKIYNRMTKEFLFKHETVDLEKQRLLSFASSPQTLVTRAAEVQFDKDSRTFFVEGCLGPEIFLWAVREAVKEANEFRIVIGDILSEDWASLSCFRDGRISSVGLQLPHLAKENEIVGMNAIPKEPSRLKIRVHDFEIHELAAIHQALVTCKKRLGIIQFKRRRGLSKLIKAVEASMIDQAGALFDSLEDQAEDN